MIKCNDEHIVNGAGGEVWIESSHRVSQHSVSELANTDSLVRIGVNAGAIDACIARLLSVVADYPVDTVIFAIGVMFALILDRFKFRSHLLLATIWRYLGGRDDEKIAPRAFRLMLGHYFEDKLRRNQIVKFKPRKVKF